MNVLVLVATVAASVSLAASAQSQGAKTLAPLQWQTGSAKPLVLMPVAGTWTADYENAEQILTIDGAAPAKAPDAAAAASIFGAQAREFVSSLAAPGAFPLAVARDVKTFVGGRLQVRFKLIDGATDQTAGILFNLKPNGSYTYARYNTKDGNVAVWKFDNGARTVLQHGELHEQLPKGEWHTLEVTVTGTAVAATVNGRLSVRHTLDAPVEGRVGVWTKADSVTAFRGFHARHAGHRHSSGARQP